ncbi:MAG: carboxypeptidase-like regulatory domain-containing protein [Paludibacteraceae bacterium]|nr:carboxypeptidase-like regulatory domain-containing protein [Paludibacteraceae bacterium]
MRKKLLLAFAIFASLSAVSAQNLVRGVVKIAGTGEPAVGAVVTLQGQKTSAVTNEWGEFVIDAPKSGDEVLTIVQEGYDVESKSIAVSTLETLDLGVVMLLSKEADTKAEITEDMFMAMSDIEFDDEDGLASQSISGVLYARGDVFSGAASYAFSPARYRLRGYDQRYESTYINGINFNDGERGRFNYSSIGGLNYAMRNKELVNNFAPNAYTYGNLGNTTNIDVRASKYAKGGQVGLSGTNRSYWLRAQATYATGIMDNGWAVAVSGAYRWSQEGRIEGTFYNAGAIFLSAEKIINNHHSVNIAAYCAPTERAGSSALTQETVDLTSIYYNPYWGWQDGKKRNSRIVHSYDPTLLLNYDWKIQEGETFKVGAGAHYSMYSNSALTFYNAPDPRPDYYRNLPSYQLGGWGLAADGNYYHDYDYRMSGGSSDWQGGDQTKIQTNVDMYNQMTEDWRTGYKQKGNTTTQLDWAAMYNANYANNSINPDGMAKYMIERRHNNIFETTLNANYENKTFDKLNIVAGLEAKYSRGSHYKTIDDLMGANQWYDIDPFSDRDINDLAEDVQMTAADVAKVRLNDLSNLNEDGTAKKVNSGDKFGYNYDLNITRIAAFAHNDWNFNDIEFYYGLKFTYTNFYRYGHMENGRAWFLSQQLGEDVISKGKGAVHNFYDPSLKAGFVYKFNGHHRLSVNVLAETRAPLPTTYYISQRTTDRSIETFYNKYPTASGLLKSYGLSEKILSYDLNYIVTYPRVRGRLSLYRTHSIDGTESNGYYNDEYRTFVNHIMYNVNKIYQGGELGVSVKLNSSFTLSGAVAYNEAHYTNNPIGVQSAENGMRIDGQQEVVDRILLKSQASTGKAVKVASGPQLTAMLKLNYFHSKMWFADLSISYLDENYLGVAPSRFSQGMITGKRADGSNANLWYGANCTTAEKDANIAALASQESLFDGAQWYNHILVDASVGKLIYLKGGKSININVSLNNVTNNTGLKTGGWQQARIPTTVYRQTTYKVSNYVDKYPSKYYYAWGFNFFLNVGFKF